MLDIDYFKRYNDTYGHQAGDDCLTRVARVLKQSVRTPDDVVSRYGGEEFLVILFNCPRTSRKRLPCVFRTACAQRPYRTAPQRSATMSP
jgi:diguanylate cyclase (GGDEF)-like protein